MALYAAQFETAVQKREAWQRVSATQLRKKLVSTWSRKYVGIKTKAAADTLLTEVITTYANVNEGAANMDPSGVWEVVINFKTAEWVSPAVYMNG